MTRPVLLALLFMPVLFSPRGAHAKQGWTFAAGADVTYDSNVWRLEEGQMEKPGSDTEPGEKYYEMESATDTVVGVYGRVEWETRAFATRKTRFRIAPGASLHLLNPKRSYATVDARVSQSVWKGGDVYLELGFVPARFKRNYLFDASDTDGDGRVSSSEKTYEEGVTTETGARLGLRSRVTRALAVEVSGGVVREGYAAPLENRSRVSTGVGAGLELELGKRAEIGLDYELWLVGTGNEEEVVVSNRQALVTPVDRSSTAHVVSPAFSVELGDPIDLRARYQLLLRSYSSTGDDDPYRDREDVRHTASLELRVRIAKALRLDLGGSFSRAVAERPNDPDAEPDEVDYERFLAWIGFAASF